MYVIQILSAAEWWDAGCETTHEDEALNGWREIRTENPLTPWRVLHRSPEYFNGARVVRSTVATGAHL